MKKEKNKKESTLEKKINELKKTSKGKAILRLIKWCVFFTILFIFLAVVSMTSPKNITKPNINNETKEPDATKPIESNDNWNSETLTIENLNKYQEMLSNIYDYNYEIKINNLKYAFSGTKTPTEDKGYKESKEGIIKYIIDNTGTYMETTGERILINNLYEEIEENYINPVYILNILKELEITRDRECDCIELVYKANDNKNMYRVYILDDKITRISIAALDFSNLYTILIDNIK